MEREKMFEDNLERLRRSTEQVFAAQQDVGVVLGERLVLVLREHLYRYPCTNEAARGLVRSAATLPNWLCDTFADSGSAGQLVGVGPGVFALDDGTGRWMLTDINTGMVSVELWHTAIDAAEAAAKGDVSWSEPVNDDEDEAI